MENGFRDWLLLQMQELVILDPLLGSNLHLNKGGK